MQNFDLEKIRANLVELAKHEKPQKSQATIRDSISLLTAEIKILLEKGFTIKDIAEAIQSSADGVSVRTLQNYVSETKRKIDLQKIRKKSKKSAGRS